MFPSDWGSASAPPISLGAPVLGSVTAQLLREGPPSPSAGRAAQPGTVSPETLANMGCNSNLVLGGY